MAGQSCWAWKADYAIPGCEEIRRKTTSGRDVEFLWVYGFEVQKGIQLYGYHFNLLQLILLFVSPLISRLLPVSILLIASFF